MTMKIGGIEFDITVDADGVKRATTSSISDLERLQKKLKDTDAPAAGAGRALGKMGRSAGQAGIQVQQLVGQIQGGQNVFGALSAQAADLGIVLGAPLIGAATGLAAALAGALVPSLFNSGEATKTLREELEELAKTQLLTEEQAKFLAAEERKSIEEREKSIKSIKDEIAERKALVASREKALSGDLTPELAQRQARYKTEIKEANEFILEQDAKLSLLNQQQEDAKSKLDAYNLAVKGGKKLSDDQQESIDKVKQSLTAQIVALKGGAQAAEVYAATQAAMRDGTEDALPSIIQLINQKYEEKRAIEAATEARRQEAETKRKIEEEEQARKDRIGSNLDRLREELMSEEQLRAEAFLTKGEQLQEALEAEHITKQEYDALEKERVSQHQQWLIDKERQTAQERSNIEKRHQDVVNSFRTAAVQNAMGLLDVFAGESRAAAIAAIAINKGLALAQNTQNTLVAQTRALAELGPIAGPPVAAKIGAYGAINAALIAATGLAQAANLGGGASSGGLSAVNTTNNQSAQGNPNAGGNTQRNISIALTGSSFSGGDIRTLIGQINEELGDGATLNVTGG